MIYAANKTSLRLLRRAVTKARAAREALDDLRDIMSENSFSDQMVETLEAVVAEFDLHDVKPGIQELEHLIRALVQEAP